LRNTVDYDRDGLTRPYLLRYITTTEHVPSTDAFVERLHDETSACYVVNVVCGKLIFGQMNSLIL